MAGKPPRLSIIAPSVNFSRSVMAARSEEKENKEFQQQQKKKRKKADYVAAFKGVQQLSPYMCLRFNGLQPWKQASVASCQPCLLLCDVVIFREENIFLPIKRFCNVPKSLPLQVGLSRQPCSMLLMFEDGFIGG
jgi:hypothetical protein